MAMDDVTQPLRIIQVEDNANDAELVQRALARSGAFFSATRVQTREALCAALEQVGADLVLCDYRLPQFDGKEALGIVREKAPHVPVVMVTGALGDEEACELLKMGARDFVLKDRLARLGPAVRRALVEEQGVRARKMTEAALRESELKYRRLFEGARDALLVLDAQDGQILDANTAAEDLLVHARQDLVGRTFGEIDALRALPTIEVICRNLGSGKGAPVGVGVRTVPGRTIEVEAVFSRYAVGGREHVMCNLRDVTERHLAEQALRRSEVLFRALVENSADIFLITAADGTIRYASPAVSQVVGAMPEEVVGSTLRSFLSPEELASGDAAWQRILSSPHLPIRHDHRLKTRDGSLRWIEAVSQNLLADPALGGVVVVLRDITERKAGEDKLRLANLAVERSQTVVFCWRDTPDWEVIYASENVSQWGYEAGALMAEGRPYAGLMHPADCERVRRELEAQRQAGVTPFKFEYRLRTAGGGWRWVEERSTIQGANGDRYFQGTILDITARREADEELRRSRVSLAEAQAIARIGNWGLDVATRDITWSDESYRILGVARGAFRPTYDSVMARIHPDDRPKAEAAVRETLNHGAPMSLEHRFVLDDGSVRWVHERAIVVYDNDRRPLQLIGTVQDITERREAQNALAATLARMKLQLAGIGVASRVEASNAGDLGKLAPVFTELAARTLSAGHAGIWLLDDAGAELRGIDTFAPAASSHGPGQVRQGPDLREQLEALCAARYIEVSDARNDPRTKGHVEKYLRPLDVGALLQVAVQVDGRCLGVLEIAHVGGPRTWHGDEVVFACQLADKVGFALMAVKRHQIEEQLRRSNRALRTLSAVNAALVHVADENELYRQMCRIAVEVGGYGIAWIGLGDASRGVEVAAMAAAEGCDAQRCADTLRRTGGAIDRVIREGGPQTSQCAEGMCVVLPLKHGKEAFGALAICQNDGVIEADEQPVLAQLAADLGYGIRTLRTRAAHERGEVQLRETMEATVHAVAGMVELRDPYTAGHQRRVSELAVAIGRELGLSADRLHGLGLAATIHDVGKIIVPAEILSKPGRLTPIEYEVVKQHPEAGYDIIKDVRFPWPIAEMVRQHHERVDGSGYPRGLKGDQILLEASIIGVADVIEAIASHRPYRPSLGIAPALREIESGRGTKYDARVVDACLRMFRAQGYQLPT